MIERKIVDGKRCILFRDRVIYDCDEWHSFPLVFILMSTVFVLCVASILLDWIGIVLSVAYVLGLIAFMQRWWLI